MEFCIVIKLMSYLWTECKKKYHKMSSSVTKLFMGKKAKFRKKKDSPEQPTSNVNECDHWRKEEEIHHHALSGGQKYKYQETADSSNNIITPVIHENEPYHVFQMKNSYHAFCIDVVVVVCLKIPLQSSTSSSSTSWSSSVSSPSSSRKTCHENQYGNSDVSKLTSRFTSVHRSQVQNEFSGHSQTSVAEERKQSQETDEVNSILDVSGLLHTDMNLNEELDMPALVACKYTDETSGEPCYLQRTSQVLKNKRSNEVSDITCVKKMEDFGIQEVIPCAPDGEAVVNSNSARSSELCNNLTELKCSWGPWDHNFRMLSTSNCVDEDISLMIPTEIAPHHCEENMNSQNDTCSDLLEPGCSLCGRESNIGHSLNDGIISCLAGSSSAECVPDWPRCKVDTSDYYEYLNSGELLALFPNVDLKVHFKMRVSMNNNSQSCADPAEEPHNPETGWKEMMNVTVSQVTRETQESIVNVKYWRKDYIGNADEHVQGEYITSSSRDGTGERDAVGQRNLENSLSPWNKKLITFVMPVNTVHSSSDDRQEQDNSRINLHDFSSSEDTGTKNTADPITNVRLPFCLKSNNKQGENVEDHLLQQVNTQGTVNTPQNQTGTEAVYSGSPLPTPIKFLPMIEQPATPMETLDMQMTHKEETSQEKETGSERVSSRSDLNSVLGHGFRYTDWGLCQNLVVYPIFRPELLNQLMNHELLRLCSYSNSYLPINGHMMATYLAQSGFYCLTRDGDVRCFSCGREYPGFLIGTPPENAHDRRCRHRQENIPLSTMTQGISAEQLDQYFTHYEGPAVLHEREQMGGGERYQSSAHEYRDNSGLLSTTARSQSSGYATGLSGATSAEHTLSMGHEEADSSFAEVPHNREEESDNRAHSEPLHAASNRPRNGSLPPDLNDLSGAIVSQESQREDSMQVYTSAASRPIDLTITQPPPPADNGGDRAEGGAVGGHDTATGQVNDLRRASYPQFASQQSRLASFRAWSADHSHRPEDLAAAGFFYAGYADCVRCFYCGVGLKYWRETDIPAYQHARFRPHCVYNILYKGQEYIDRVQEDVRQQGQAGGPEQGVGGIAPQAGLHQAPTEPEVPETGPMASAAALAALGDGWSRDQVQRAVNHIMEELGENCLQPDILADVLNNLQMEPFDLQEPDPNRADALSLSDEEEPLEGNDIRFRDDEPQVSQTLPQRREQTGAGDSAAHGAQAHIQQPAPAQLNPEEEMRVVEREHNYLMQRTTCSICQTQPVSCVFLPCGHVTACEPCADAAERCNLCHKNIIGTANIYLA